MSMIGDLLNEEMAKELEEVLLAAANDSEWGDVRSAVKGFCKKKIYLLYKNHLESSYGAETDHRAEVQKIYEN